MSTATDPLLPRRVVVACCVLLALVPLAARQAAAPATFEVASIKRSADSGGPRLVRAGAREGNHWLANNATLLMIVRNAYAPTFNMDGTIVGGPDWVRNDRFDINATFDPAVTNLQPLVRALLAERFTLSTHVEQRELSIYELVVAREDRRLGPQLRPLTIDCDAIRAARQRGELPNPGLPPPPAPGQPSPPPQCITLVMESTTSRVQSGGMTIAQLLPTLSQLTARPVVDRTGLAGFYELKLEFARDPTGPTLGPVGPGSPATSDAPSLFAALQDQLGLKLESKRQMVDVLVIDRVEPPTEN